MEQAFITVSDLSDSGRKSITLTLFIFSHFFLRRKHYSRSRVEDNSGEDHTWQALADVSPCYFCLLDFALHDIHALISHLGTFATMNSRD